MMKKLIVVFIILMTLFTGCGLELDSNESQAESISINKDSVHIKVIGYNGSVERMGRTAEKWINNHPEIEVIECEFLQGKFGGGKSKIVLTYKYKKTNN